MMRTTIGRMRWRHPSILWPLAVVLALNACVMSSAATTPPELTGTTWSWQSTRFADGERILAARPADYTIELQPEGNVRVRADCNRGGGRYSHDGAGLTIGAIATTKKGCPADTQDHAFLAGLADVSGYRFEGDALVLTLRSRSGSMTFTRLPR